MVSQSPLELPLLERANLERIARSPKSLPFEARRASAILSYSDGLSVFLIAQVLRVEATTVIAWISAYKDDNANGLRQKPYPEREGKLTKSQETAIKEQFRLNGAGDTRQIQAFILEQFGVEFSRSGTIKLLYRLGFRYKKPKIVNPVASEAAQMAHLAHYAAVKASGEPILFIDAVHPQFQTRAYGGWFLQETKPALPAQTGRARINIHGALEIATGKLIFREDLRVNADNFLKLLQQIENAYPQAPTIHLFLDNAKYHRAKMVQEWLNSPNRRVKLHFLPPYCPHFNAIERLWGVMHKVVSKNVIHANFKAFANAHLSFLRDKINQQWHNFKTAVTDNFSVKSNKDLNFIRC